MLPGPPSGSNESVNEAHDWFCPINEVMKGLGWAATAPCERIAPVADVKSKPAAIVPVANAIVDAAPRIPDVTMNAPETESYVTTGGVPDPVTAVETTAVLELRK